MGQNFRLDNIYNCLVHIIWILIIFLYSATDGKLSECEKITPQGFTSAQKAYFCNEISSGNVVGAVLCAREAKFNFKLSFEQIINLCVNASGTEPLGCLKSISAKDRQIYGAPLCGGARSLFPGKCWHDVSQIKIFDSVVEEDLLSFCRGVTSDANLICLTSATQIGKISIKNSLSACSHTSNNGSVITDCIEALLNRNKIQNEQEKSHILSFCAKSDTNIPKLCFLNSNSLKQIFSVQDRLDLCENAVSDVAPVSCVTDISRVSPQMTVPSLISTCRGAITHESKSSSTSSINLTSGTAICFRTGRTSGLDDTVLARLCRGTKDAGPVTCYRRSNIILSNLAHRGDDVDPRLSLCEGEESEAAAECVSRLPPWLAVQERISLCKGSPQGRHSEPGRCLQTLESAYRNFAQSPSTKVLAVPYAAVSSGAPAQHRQKLLALCSFWKSLDPVAASECLQFTPVSVRLEDALGMCANTSRLSSGTLSPNAQTGEGGEGREVGMCVELLPSEWSSADTRILCGGVKGIENARAVTGCARRSRGVPLRLRVEEAARLCRYEVLLPAPSSCSPSPGSKVGRGTQKLGTTRGKCSSDANSDADGPVYTCLMAARRTFRAGLQAMDKGVLERVCGGLAERASNSSESALELAAEGGQCVGRVLLQSQLHFEVGALAHLCLSQQPLLKLKCIEKSAKRIIQASDVDNCVAAQRVVMSVRLRRFLAQDNQIEVTAGKWFSLWLLLLDQWGETIDMSGLTVAVSINANNPQGAVLWGSRSNSSSAEGVVELSQLVISQPGRVELSVIHHKRTIEIFTIEVLPNPDTQNADMCVDAFRLAMCPLFVPEATVMSEFPYERGYFLSTVDNAAYGLLWGCAETLYKWQVTVTIEPGVGAVWIQYKKGLEAIWTGVGLPNLDMSPYVQLGVSTNASSKEIRRAYYKKSLQWHPDRWATMSQYIIPVTTAFTLISDAYALLSHQDGPL